MTIGSALNNALSGLNAASRGVELVSSNVANASTPSYGRRELSLTSRTLGTAGAGVQVAGVTRVVDQALLTDRRIANAAAGSTGVAAKFHAALEGALGTPDSQGALSQLVDAFDASLLQAASMPNSDARLASVLNQAQRITQQFHSVSNLIQATRTGAEQAIAHQVGQLNDALDRVATMNRQIRSETAAGHDASALMDQRQQLIDQISDVVPILEISRDHNQVALFTTGGAMLQDGQTARFGFTPVSLVTADMTLASGALSGLTLNGRDIATDGGARLIAGGTLAAQFELRDGLAPTAQAQLDGLARDLIERFADPSVDPTLAPGDPGLFTDAGVAVDPTLEAGLAGRIAVHGAVVPEFGGALWRLRDGIGATVPGPVGNAAILNAMETALGAPRAAVSGGLSNSAIGFGAQTADLLSRVGTNRQNAEGAASYAAARSDTLQTLMLEKGVDTDQEMQKMLILEQAYGANAKVLQTLGGLLDQLLQI
ncbi:flagellar hook protein FlgK [Defluviimonas sp. 20V17]|uniref:Flagellar hook-associated protein 1 n=1 Tax=Allgaiera indica TaxID=765699 RepID=A0AAN4ZZC1_9RHOB|nr:flagellar hook-associated protein FlgK [Allgaiera indica]KDB02666.1 flagellar hook protein FlgK [Defluviimonas sp. 20V17]GHE01828.1 flagellar hook-associated protein [Allgaiera indica]SDW92381.1 flagellar hook-associated protein 1 FlgK [Allgaiera indica]